MGRWHVRVSLWVERSGLRCWTEVLGNEQMGEGEGRERESQSQSIVRRRQVTGSLAALEVGVLFL